MCALTNGHACHSVAIFILYRHYTATSVSIVEIITTYKWPPVYIYSCIVNMLNYMLLVVP